MSPRRTLHQIPETCFPAGKLDIARYFTNERCEVVKFNEISFEQHEAGGPVSLPCLLLKTEEKVRLASAVACADKSNLKIAVLSGLCHLPDCRIKPLLLSNEQ